MLITSVPATFLFSLASRLSRNHLGKGPFLVVDDLLVDDADVELILLYVQVIIRLLAQLPFTFGLYMYFFAKYQDLMRSALLEAGGSITI